MQTALVTNTGAVVENTSSAQSKLKIAPILISALIARAIVAFVMLHNNAQDWFYKEATELGALAHSILIGHGLASPFGGSTGPSAFLPPGYPALIACIFRLFGSYSIGSAVAIIALQMFFAI